MFASASAAALPPRSGVIVADSGPWYIDATTGAVGRVRIQPPPPPGRRPSLPPPPVAAPPKRRLEPPTVSEQVIVDRPDGARAAADPLPLPRRVRTDADNSTPCCWNSTTTAPSSRSMMTGSSSASTRRAARLFARRDRAAEAAAQEAIRQDGLVQMRMATAQAEKGRLVFVFRGRDAAEAWQGFVAERLPALQALGWRNQIDTDFGPRLVQIRRAVRHAGQPMPPGCGARVVLAGFRHRDRRRPPSAAADPDAPARTRRHGRRAGHRRRGDHQPGRRPHPETAGRTHRPPAGGDGGHDRGRQPHHRRHDGAGRRRRAHGAGSGGRADHPLAGRRRSSRNVARFRAITEIPEAPVPRQLHRQPAPLSAARRQLAAASAGERPGRIARGRYGPGQDRADHRPYRHRGRRRPSRPAGAGGRPDQPGAQLDRPNLPGSRRICAWWCCTGWIATNAGAT